ncbi:hypothetical protein [uncultured Maribacter sp.]|uniref:hypothetical protein n=1 Tax=uncultured Maribacter sp. TaxID=431308 RepID=UPI002617BD38|nr:hypothetical protein [uncultured Maribacter sp.]
MTIQVQKVVFNFVTTILIMGGYLFYVFEIQGDINLPKVLDIKFWGVFILELTMLMVLAKIILFILFAIFKKVNNRNKDEEDLGFIDERDKLIEMKSDRYSHWIAMFGFMVSMIPVSMGYSVHYMFITILSFGFVSSVMSDVWKIYFYNKGL